MTARRRPKGGLVKVVAIVLALVATVAYLPPTIGGSADAAAPSPVVHRVNVGGGQVAGSPAWSADFPWAPSSHLTGSGEGFSTGAPIDLSDPSLPAGTPAELFTTQRYDVAGGSEMTWAFPTAPGQFEVRLYFAELYEPFFQPGKREFDVAIEGQTVLDDFDVAVAASGGNKGIMRSFPVTSDGTIDLQFLHQVDNPIVSAVEIVDLQGQPAASVDALQFGQVLIGQTATLPVTISNSAPSGGETLALSSANVTGAGSASFTRSFAPVTLSPGQSTTLDIDFTPAAIGAVGATLQVGHDGPGSPLSIPLSGIGGSSGPVVHRVDVGGGPVADTPVWSADSPSPYLVGSTEAWSTGPTVDVSDPSLPAGTPEELFRSQRYDVAGGSDMTWAFPTGPGQYEVRLYFAELYEPFGEPGKRVFDVAAEGQTVLDDFDVALAAGGANRAVMRSFVVTSDATLDLTFLHGVDNPVVNAIEIIDLRAQATASAPALNFGTTTVGQSSTQPVTITNAAPAGSAPLTVTSTAISGPGVVVFADAFVDATPVLLAPGQSTTFDVTFTPTAIGSIAATLNVDHNGPGATLTIPLSGVGSMTGGTVVNRVSVGGEQLAGTPAWSGDTPSPFLVGSTESLSTGSSIDLSDPSIPVGTPGDLFRSQRYDLPGGSEMTWAFPSTPGQYEVRLYFAELYEPFFQPGKRVFDVTAEGQTVLDDFDVVAAAGAGNKGVMRSFLVTSDGTLDLQFQHGVDNPIVNGIEIVRFGDAAATASATSLPFGQVTAGTTATLPVTVTNSAPSGSAPLTITGTTISGTGAAKFTDNFVDATPVVLAPGESTTFDVTYAAAFGNADATLQVGHDGNGSPLSIALSGVGTSAGGSIVQRVNVGGSQVVDAPVWSADSPSPYLVGSTEVFSSGATIDVTSPSVPAGTPASLFRTQRYDAPGGSEMTWAIPAAAGQYEVRLYFAELYAPFFQPGKRVFDVTAEGQTVLDDFDVVAAAGGGNKGVVRSFTVSSDGTIDLQFLHGVDNPILNAIEIVKLADAQSAASVGSLSFGHIPVGQTATLPVTVTNTAPAGSSSLTISSTAIAGTGAASFADDFVDATPVVLAPGQSTTINVTYTASAIGSADAALQITHDGPGTPLSVPLSGAGTYEGGTIAQRVNVGGPEVAGSPTWTADTPSPWLAGNTTVHSTGATIDTSDPSLPVGTPAGVLSDQRSGNGMTWMIPVTPGRYEARVYFAEIDQSATAGSRVFDVLAEGNQLVLDDFDPYVAAGRTTNKGVMRSFVVDADVILDLQFNAVAGEPMVNAIELVKIPAQVDMKLLVIGTDGSELYDNDLVAITTFLEQVGVPYDTFLSASQTLTPETLASAPDHAKYQGIVLTTGGLFYSEGGAFTSGLSPEEWTILRQYQSRFGIRSVTSFTAPDAAYGLAPATPDFVNTLNNPHSATLTTAGQGVFPYMNAANPIEITGAWTYLGTVIDPAVTTPLVNIEVNGQQYPLASITKYQAGYENLAFTQANHFNLIHSMVFSYGWINWVTQGQFLGEQAPSTDYQIDDLFSESDMWNTTTNASTDIIRNTPADINALVAYQNSLRTSGVAPNFFTEWAYNMELAGEQPALVNAVLANESQFGFINHTFQHYNLDCGECPNPTGVITAPTSTVQQEITSNFAAANAIGLDSPPDAMVQPDISGIDTPPNPAVQQAVANIGIRYWISDTSKPAHKNPTFNTGFYAPGDPRLFIIPRNATNLFYSASTPAQWTDMYNHFYAPGGVLCGLPTTTCFDRPQTYTEILDHESEYLVRYLLRGELNPVMFHIPNTRAYDGTHSLMSDVIDATLAKYTALVDVPITSHDMVTIGGLMKERAAYDASGVTATRTACSNITVTATNAAKIPLSGINYTGPGATVETLGSRTVTTLSLAAGQSVTIPTPCEVPVP